MNVKRVLAAFAPCKRRIYYARYYSKDLQNTPSNAKEQMGAIKNPDLLFSQSESAWDRVFANLDDYKALSSPSRRDMTRKLGHQRQGQPGRRQAMTAREISAFDDIFNMIFDAAAKHEDRDSIRPSGSSEVNVISDIFTSLRLNSRGPKWTTDQDEFLDLRKEEVDLCASDMELLRWAQREVLDRFDNAQHGSKHQDAKSEQVEDTIQPSSHSRAQYIRTYSHLVGYLMRTFRDKYRDPYLALALFDKVQRRSLMSYVFGCSTQVYHELIETKWACFRDLRGVHDALEEMAVNGVAVDGRMRKLVEMVRRQAGERNEWAENLDIRSGEVWNLLLRLDHFIAKSTSSKKKVHMWDQWKKERPEDKAKDGWGFDHWSKG